SSRRRHTRSKRDWSSDVCSSDLARLFPVGISQIITDNGKEFLGNFDKTLQEAAIKHLWTYPYTPKMNAICERFNRTLREQFIERSEEHTSELQSRFDLVCRLLLE